LSDSVVVIIPAGGSGERLGAKLPKALVQVAGKTLIEHAVANIAPVAQQIIVAVPAGYEETFRGLLGSEVTLVAGGATRTASVKAALAVVDQSHDYVLVHDAARALASTELAWQIVASLRAGEKAVVPGLDVKDTMKEVDPNLYATKTLNRSALRIIQTPQGFDRKVLVDAHKSTDDSTDDSTLVEKIGIAIKVIPGEERALKITTPADLEIAHQIALPEILESAKNIRVGIGTDAHAFSVDPNRQLYLAGLHWTDHIGVDGHSDGDVAAHAICDALLAAAELGDLGSNFGTSSPQYAGASGSQLLSETFLRISAAGYSINNVSVQIVGNSPKIGPRRAEAITAISTALNGATVSVSATTTDGLGFTGEGKGLSAIATALLIKTLDRIY
jgi:2-C-methyl-D-erythritol 4-phosphate cytidylyltransferase/2-C-methyl-D-erythritol 2,4-cyclodiphosphate synthase